VTVESVQPRLNRRVLLAALSALALGNVAATAEPQTVPVRVVMVEDVGCRFCAAWEREVGMVYDKSLEGQFAPLQRVRRGAPELANLAKPATFTPTFIVMQGSTEKGRITGYPGESYFWEELKEILLGLGFGATQPSQHGNRGP
jgi:protein-disulfide isomerase